MIEDQYSDIRKHKRIIRPFMVRVRLYQQAGSQKNSKWDIVKVRDLSEGGISFNYDKRIAPGIKLEFRIALPLNKEPIRCIGIVCRIDSSPNHSGPFKKISIYGVAVRFIEIEPIQQEAITKFAKDFFK